MIVLFMLAIDVNILCVTYAYNKKHLKSTCTHLLFYFIHLEKIKKSFSLPEVELQVVDLDDSGDSVKYEGKSNTNTFTIPTETIREYTTGIT